MVDLRQQEADDNETKASLMCGLENPRTNQLFTNI